MKISTLLATASLTLIAMTTASGAYAQEDPKPAPIGDSFMRGMKDPSQLADLIEAYLKNNVDPTGKQYLDPAKCDLPVGKSCGSPWAYLSAFQRADPKAQAQGLLDRIDQLPAYLRSLTEDTTPHNEEWYSACIQPLGGGSYNVIDGCVLRKFHPGEKVWKSPTGIDVLAGDCTNPLFGKIEDTVVEPSCVKISVTRPAGTQVVRWEVTPDNLGSICWGITQAGGIKTEMTDQCPNKNCTFAGGNAFLVKHEERLGYHVVIGNEPRMGSFVPAHNDQEAVDVFTVPPSIKKGGSLNVCITVKLADGTVVTYKVKHLFFHETDKGSEFATHTPWVTEDDAD